MKLYSDVKREVEIGKIINTTNSDPSLENTNIDENLLSLEKHLTAFYSLNVIHDHIASENFNFVDKGNYVLYNEYIKSITNNLGIKERCVIAQETIDNYPGIVVNHHLSLEGFVKDVWEKIKSVFNSITNAVKDFFTKYFTRLGRLKNKLKNLSEVLSETNKDIGKLVLDDVPSGLANKFPVSGTLNLSVVEEAFKNVSALGETLKNINTASLALAKKEILDRDFVSKVKSLKDLAAASKDKISDNNEKKGLNPFSKKNKELRKENSSLKDTIDSAEKEVENSKNDVSEITEAGSNQGLEIDDTAFNAAKKEFDALLGAINLDLGKLKGKRLIGGKVITDIKVKEDTGLEVDTEEKKDNPDKINLASKSELIKLINETIKLMESVELLSKNYGTVNEQIVKSIDDVDKIIKDIDVIASSDLGKYKTVLNNKIKVRLSLLKNFFTNYNKICKSLFGMVIDSAEGNADYTVLCLKYFGDNK